MELHKALRNIIQTDGPEILKEVRLVNILDDFNAYQDIPASKYILRAIIADGYSTKLITIGKWDNSAKTLINKFSTVTGFIPESVSLIIQSMAYGLGWINTIAPITSNSAVRKQTSNSPFPLPNRTCTKIGWRKGMSEDEIEQYILSMIEFDRSREKVLNVHIENLSLGIDEYNQITYSFEFLRDKPKASGTLWYAVYDLKNKVKKVSIFGSFYSSDINNKPFANYIIGVDIKDVSKIRLYWGD